MEKIETIGEEPPSETGNYSQYKLSLSPLILAAISANTWSFSDYGLLCIFIAFLIIGSALMSGSEVAYFSLDRQQTDDLDKERSPSAFRIVRLLNNPQKLLACILIVNNLFNIAIILSLHLLTHNLLAGFSPVMHFVIEVGVITFILVLFGEIIPKVYARQFNIKMARFMALPLSFFQSLFSPLISILVGSSTQIENLFNKKLSKLSSNDIDQALEMLDHTHENEREILKRVVDFPNIETSEIMTNRTKVVYAKSAASFEELYTQVINGEHSRIPICEEDLDDVVGFIYVKDLLQYNLENQPQGEWQKLIRKPFFVYENTKLDKLLDLFKTHRKHIAVVADEYGGASGIVTLEDVLEEVVGEIADENEEIDPVNAKKIGHNTWTVEGLISLLDLSKILDINHTEFDEFRGDSDTLAGMLLEQKQSFLQKNDLLRIGNYTYKVISTNGNVVEKVRIKVSKPSKTDDTETPIQNMNGKEDVKGESPNRRAS